MFAIDNKQKDGRNVYCRQCRSEMRRIRIAKSKDKICRICGKAFKSEKPATTCSIKCRGIAESVERVEKTCLSCGKVFKIRKTDVENRPVRGTYCSTKCRHKHLTERISGDKHGCWRGGHEKYRGPNWHRQRSKAIARDNNKCAMCGKEHKEGEKELTVHHIIPFRFFNNDYKKANQLSNLITLCESCHAKQESHWWKEVPRELKGVI